MGKLTDKKGYICDMDGVIYHGDRLVEGAKEFVSWLKAEGKRFPFFDQQQCEIAEGAQTQALASGNRR